MIDPMALAQELMAAYSSGRLVPVPPSSRDADFDLPTAYAVEGEIARMRLSTGRSTVGRKVGYANKALWRILKLDTIVWAHMYDDTVRWATSQPIAAGETWTATVEGLDLPDLTVRVRDVISGRG